MALTELLINGLVYQYLAEKFAAAFGLRVSEKWYRFVRLYDSYEPGLSEYKLLGYRILYQESSLFMA